MHRFFDTKNSKKRKIPKSKELMVGSSYKWDYESVVKKGIEAVLIKSNYMHEHKAVKEINKTIDKLSDIFKYI